MNKKSLSDCMIAQQSKKGWLLKTTAIHWTGSALGSKKGTQKNFKISATKNRLPSIESVRNEQVQERESSINETLNFFCSIPKQQQQQERNQPASLSAVLQHQFAEASAYLMMQVNEDLI